MATAEEMEPLTSPSAMDQDELIAKLQEFLKEEDKLLEKTLSEQWRSDDESATKLEKLMALSIMQQKAFEGRIANLRSEVDGHQSVLKSASGQVQDLMQKYPWEFMDHQNGEVEHEANEATDMLDIMAEMSRSTTRVSRVSSNSAATTASSDCRKSLLGRIVCSTAFDAVCTAVIAVNAVYIGVQVEYAVQNIGKKPSWQQPLEISFFVCYLIELLLKLVVHKCKFFTNPDWLWNIFDSALVFSAACDLLLEMANPNGGAMNLSWMRLLRLMKMLKLLRVVRVMRFFRDLRLMMSMIGQSFRSLFWALLMLGLIMYMFGLCFLQGVTGYLEENKDREIDPKVRLAIEKYWDSVYDAICTLFMAITRGIDWRLASEPLEEVGQAYHMLFLLYISFTMFAVLNIITGVFVEASFVTVTQDRANVSSEAMKVATAYGMKLASHMLRWCSVPDVLSQEEFLHACAEDDILQEIVNGLEIEETELIEMFEDMAKANNIKGRVKVKDLASALLKLKGPAQAMDIVQLSFGCGKYEEAIENFMIFIEEQFLSMRRALQYRLHHPSSYVMPLHARLKASRSMPVKVFSQ